MSEDERFYTYSQPRAQSYEEQESERGKNSHPFTRTGFDEKNTV